jgi:hypothetical protein
MPEFIAHYLDIVRNVRRCRPEIKDAAEKLAHLTAEEYGTMVQELVDSGKEDSLDIVCNLCAANGIQLAPELTAQVLKVIEPIIDFAPLYRFQDKAAIKPLLEAALDEELSIERQVYAALVAVEMCLIHDSDTKEALRVLRILEQSYAITPMLGMLLGNAFDLLEHDKENLPTKHFLSQADIYSLLPKESPPIVIVDGGTLRHSTPRIGRNEPCPCGSGKKYKNVA